MVGQKPGAKGWCGSLRSRVIGIAREMWFHKALGNTHTGYPPTSQAPSSTIFLGVELIRGFILAVDLLVQVGEQPMVRVATWFSPRVLVPCCVKGFSFLVFVEDIGVITLLHLITIRWEEKTPNFYIFLVFLCVIVVFLFRNCGRMSSGPFRNSRHSCSLLFTTECNYG